MGTGSSTARGSGPRPQPGPGPWQPVEPLTAGARSWKNLLRQGEWAGARRPAAGRALAGVALTFAERADFDVLAVRAAFVALSFVGGLGIALYMAAWLTLPSEVAGPPTRGASRAASASKASVAAAGAGGGLGLASPEAVAPVTPGTPSTTRAEGGVREPIFRLALADKRTVALVGAVASAIVALLVAIAALGGPGPAGAVSPGVVALAALVAVRRHAGPEDRAAATRLFNLISGARPETTTTWRRLALAAGRVLAGAVLIAFGTFHLLQPKHLNGADIAAAASAFAVVGGFSLVLAPWWLRLGRELVAERRERARAEEKAEMAAHLHDSVLQTLALIQRSANDPQQVRRLARTQERQLRSWLFDEGRSTTKPSEKPQRYPSSQDGTWEAGVSSVSEALKAVQEEIEATHGIRVEVVTVGDAPMDERSMALVSAAREALVNAAKWSGADEVSVFAEISPKSASVYVRDRGRGFDPALVPGDRKGISESLKGRMRRNGGSAKVRSAPGEGTDVTLEMPRRGEA